MELTSPLQLTSPFPLEWSAAGSNWPDSPAALAGVDAASAIVHNLLLLLLVLPGEFIILDSKLFGSDQTWVYSSMHALHSQPFTHVHMRTHAHARTNNTHTHKHTYRDTYSDTHTTQLTQRVKKAFLSKPKTPTASGFFLLYVFRSIL